MSHLIRCLLTALLLTGFVGPTSATEALPELRFISKVGDKARLRVEGRYEVLTTGKTGRSGLELLSLGADSAVVRLRGRNYALSRLDRIVRPLASTLKLYRQPSHVFLADGNVNGTPLRFVVDTGASLVVLNRQHARSAGLRYSRGNKVRISTASGSHTAYEVVLDSIGIGGIYRNNVRALVTTNEFPSMPLLGNSMLKHVHVRQSGSWMIIEDG